MTRPQGLYRRLITYYSMLPRWDYILSPMDFDSEKVKAPAFRKQYLKVQTQVELMNLKHELQKSAQIALRDGVFYGAIWQNKTSFFVQRINPDYCSLTSLVDGTFIYSVDMSKISEKKLSLYPPEFTTMYNAYKSSGQKWQEVPLEICWCLKADETTMTYSIPPWSSTLPMLYDIETYKALQETASKIANYKILGMQIPLMDDGTPIGANNFPSDVRIDGETFMKTEGGKLVPYKMVAWKAAVQPNITWGFANSGDPQSLTITFDLMPDFQNDDRILDLIMED